MRYYRPLKSESLHNVSNNGRRRVVVTGVGLISPVGIGTEPCWNSLCCGRSGIGPITQFDAGAFSCQIAGEVRGFHPDDWVGRKDLKRTARFTQFAIAAAQMALQCSGLRINSDNAERVGVFVGSGIGGFEVIEREYRNLLEKGPDRVSPFLIPSALANLAAAHVSIHTGAKGPNSAVATACTTGLHSIGDASRAIAWGYADAMICGGAEAALTPLSISGFAAMRALSTRNGDPTRASRPWDRHRDGFVASEGAGILILEERQTALRRGAQPIAEVAGYGMSGDAYHPASMSPDGDGVYRAMRAALHDAGIEPEQVQYLNAHATSTPTGDISEAQAIMRLFGHADSQVAVSSTKSMTGHLLGATGAFEAAVAVLTIRDQCVPPTINLDEPDDGICLDLVPNFARPCPIEYAMTNSCGFGGSNGSMVFRRIQDS